MVIRYDIFIKYKNVFDIPYLIPDSTINFPKLSKQLGNLAISS